MQICNLDFVPFDGRTECALEQKLPKENCLVFPLPDGALFAVKATIGKDPHPLLPFSEAAIYTDGYWIVGIDRLKNEYFTPIFKKETP